MMRKIGEHAVALGASMSGLLAARVLADACRQVTVVDRDPGVARRRRARDQGVRVRALPLVAALICASRSWWAGPAAAGIIASLAVKEGIEAWHEAGMTGPVPAGDRRPARPAPALGQRGFRSRTPGRQPRRAGR
jgi:hypothetical protein